VRKHLSSYILVFLLIIVSLSSCGNTTGIIQGTVTRADDGQPVASARVHVYALEKFEEVTFMNTYQKGPVLHRLDTGPNGTYSVTLEANPYVVEVQAPGLDTGSILTEVKKGQRITLDFSLTPSSP